MYASRRCPDLLLDEISGYKAKQPGSWDDVFKRVNLHEDDGHASKLVRALAHGESKCKEFEDRREFRVKGDMWLKAAHMAIDSVEDGTDSAWVRSAGFDEAWEKFPERAQL